MDALDTSQHCECFTAPKWEFVCEDCGGRSARYQRSKMVCNPEQYSCSKCGGLLRVGEGNSHWLNSVYVVLAPKRRYEEGFHGLSLST